MKFVYLIFLLSSFAANGTKIYNFSNQNNFYSVDLDTVQRENSRVKYWITTNFSYDEIKNYGKVKIRSRKQHILVSCDNNTYKILNAFGYENFGANGNKITLYPNKTNTLTINSQSPDEVMSEFFCFKE